MVSSQVILALLLLIVYSSQQHTPPKLIFVQEIFRHGARYPEQVKNIGDQFVAKEQLLGELTDQGRSMHYLLGQQLYQRYWKKLFGGTRYEHNYDPTRFYIKSTNVNRTIESVQSQLYGIFQSLPDLTIQSDQVQFSNPPYPGVEAQAGPAFGKEGKNYHPTVVYTEKPTSDPTEIGDFLYAFSSTFCPNQHFWMGDNAKSAFADSVYGYPAFVKAMEDLSNSLTNNQNPKLVDRNSYYQYYDNLICLQSLRKPVPDLIVTPSETKRALEFLYSINANIAFSLNKTQVKSTATPFFRETLSNIHKTINNPTSPQWVLYSAHDATLTVMLGALQLWSAECIFKNFIDNVDDPFDCITTFPKFATIMVFQVFKHEKEDRSNTQIFFSNKTAASQSALYTIKINYNGAYKKIPFCGYKEECDIRAFEEWVDSWAVPDFVQACGVDKVPQYQQELKLIQYGTILTFLICSIWFFLISRRIRRIISKRGRGVLVYLGILDEEKTKKK